MRKDGIQTRKRKSKKSKSPKKEDFNDTQGNFYHIHNIGKIIMFNN